MSRENRSFRIDPFIVALLLAAVVGSLMPARGVGITVVSILTQVAVSLLFFLQGVRLQRAAVIAGATHWRLQLLTLFSTFAVFPILGVALYACIPGVIGDSLWTGVLYLCVLPSTVQSSIAFTSIARGNVPAAICAATASNLLGIALTPLLVSVVLGLHGSPTSFAQIESIVLQLLAPFFAGQVLSRWLRPWATRHAVLLSITDRGSIVLVVYASFGAAVLANAWVPLAWTQVAVLLLLCALLLAAVLCFTRFASRAFGFSREDESTVVFCGSKKSLVTGVPMANILFPAATAGLVILPLMIFHQMQLVVCSVIARRYARQVAAVCDV
ncbi:MAG: bile acid:sodium symporter family protein [Gammaproteobacteria bacterium]